MASQIPGASIVYGYMHFACSVLYQIKFCQLDGIIHPGHICHLSISFLKMRPAMGNSSIFTRGQF